MNKWNCEHPNCKNECVGTGGAVGLRAIGWFFEIGFSKNIYCPFHHPNGFELADHNARTIQKVIESLCDDDQEGGNDE